jgi:hypothetical protein
LNQNVLDDLFAQEYTHWHGNNYWGDRKVPKNAGVFVVSLFCLMALTQAVLGQELTFQIHISADALHTQTCTFGLRDSSRVGLDEFDIPSPPPSPEDPLNIHLAMMVPPVGLPNRWRDDFRPLHDSDQFFTELWVLHLNHELPGGMATIFIDQPTPATIPFELWLHHPDSSSSPVEMPAAIGISLESPTMIFYLELRMDSAVTTEFNTWGGVKSLFR